MNTTATIIFLVIIIIFLGLLYMSHGKNEGLEKAKQNLKDDNSKLSNALRKKGIEVGQLEKKIRRLEKDAKI